MVSGDYVLVNDDNCFLGLCLMGSKRTKDFYISLELTNTFLMLHFPCCVNKAWTSWSDHFCVFYFFFNANTKSCCCNSQLFSSVTLKVVFMMPSCVQQISIVKLSDGEAMEKGLATQLDQVVTYTILMHT